MGWTALCLFAKEEHYENRAGDADVFPWKIEAGEDWIRNGSLPRRPNLPLPGAIHILRQHNLDFVSHPPTNYVSINTISNVSKIGHFLNPPTRIQPFCWRNILMITSQSKCTGQDRYMYAHQCTCLSELRKIKYSKNNKKIIFFQFLFCWQQSSIGEGDSFYKTVWLTDSDCESSFLLRKYLRLIFQDNWNLSIKLDIKLIDFVLEHSAFNISYDYNRC